MHWLTLVALVAVGMSAMTCLVILRTTEWHGHLTADSSSGPQKIHQGVVPRIGGVAVLLGLLAGLMLSGLIRGSLLADGGLLLLCLLPVFLGGFYEDVTSSVSPMRRYLLAALAAGLFVWAFQISVSQIDVPGLDALLAVGWFSVIFTCFAIASVAHALNLVDGQNGLCSGVTFIVCAGLVWVSIEVRDALVFTLALLTASANIGFMSFNYPNGRIFLGDGGAYLNGAMLGILAVMIVERSDGQISPWFPVALLAYPIWETLFSMIRRKLNQRAMFDPDNEHLHSMMGRLDRHRSQCARRTKTSAPRLWAICAAPVLLAAIGYASTALMMGVFIGFIVLYQCLYRLHVISTREIGQKNLAQSH